MRIHDVFMKLTGPAFVQFFYNAFGRRKEDSQQAPTGADLSRVGTLALA